MDQKTEKFKVLTARDNFIKVNVNEGIELVNNPAPSPELGMHSSFSTDNKNIFSVMTLHGVKPRHYLLKYFEYSHSPEYLQKVSKPFSELAELMQEELPESEEKYTGLRKLLEAKDCFVRANIK